MRCPCAPSRVVAIIAIGMIVGCGAGVPQCFIDGHVNLAAPALRDHHVVFYASATGAGASAAIDERGDFHIDGSVPPGEYVVTIIPLAPPPGMANKPRPRSPVSSRYQDEKSTDLKATIVAGKNRCDFELRP
jgi:hypothetical protein